VRLVFACTPTELRRAARRRGDRSAGEGRSAFGASKLSTRAAAAKAGATTGSTRAVVSGAATVMLRLAYRAPLAAGELLAFLGARCVPGIEVLDGDGYHRTLALHHGDGTVCLQPGPGYVQAAFCLSDLRDLASAVARCRHLFGLDADPAAVDGALATDPQLHPFVARFPGLRVPGAVDGFEVAVRAVVGQQVSLAQARRLLGQMVAACGDPLSDAVSHGAAELGLEHTFPRPEQLAELVTSSAAPPWFPGPAHRRRALDELAEAVVSGRLVIDPGAAPDELRRRMLELHGVGPWTAEYVAMRALGDPDAFMPSDLALRRAASRLGLMSTPSALVGRAERWRPWRAHAQMHLWNLDAAWSRAVSLAAGSRLEDLDRGSAA
jgi:AraC family transcriptional regulator of adaptative response / DNA-3-methyladenine glycosylase II